MTRDEAEVFLGRRYLAKGFLDEALRLFMHHADSVLSDDWAQLRDGLLERGRVNDVIDVCRVGRVALPREELLALGDQYLARGDLDRAADLYEMVGADRARWTLIVDRLIELPDRQRQASAVAERHLSNEPQQEVDKRRLIKLAK